MQEQGAGTLKNFERPGTVHVGSTAVSKLFWFGIDSWSIAPKSQRFVAIAGRSDQDKYKLKYSI